VILLELTSCESREDLQEMTLERSKDFLAVAEGTRLLYRWFLTTMNSFHFMALTRRFSAVFGAVLFAAFELLAQTPPREIQLQLNAPFQFVAYGDTRFTDPNDTEASNAPVRRELVRAIADANPAFISIGGDIVYNGYDPNDWHTWDAETALWRQRSIPVYPALGNHDLHGSQKVALANYFQHFPDLKESRYYSVRAANTLALVLDSSREEVAGPQGQWLNEKLDNIPADVEFVFIVLHHPPYSSSSDDKVYGGGHSARPSEQALAKILEERQPRTRARFVIFSSHVHNYERHEHNGVTYFVTGGGGAHAYPIQRAPGDLFPDTHVNYHYLLVEVNRGKISVTMNRLELNGGKASWTKPDSTTIMVPSQASATASSN
jgi:Icc-related predicted phosphoesterase